MLQITKIGFLLVLLATTILSFLALHFDHQLGWQVFLVPCIGLFVRLLGVGIIAYHVLKNPCLTPFYKVNWLLGFLWFGIVAFPVYWYKYVWKGGLNPNTLADSTNLKVND